MLDFSFVAMILVAICVVIVLGVGWGLNLRALPPDIRWAVKGPIGNISLFVGAAAGIAYLKLKLDRAEGPDFLELAQVWAWAIVIFAVLVIVVGAVLSACVRISYAPAVAQARAAAIAKAEASALAAAQARATAEAGAADE